jgi:CRP/FNR family transcriptional regulator, dissimilatory nitrate respiration regulator
VVSPAAVLRNTQLLQGLSEHWCTRLAELARLSRFSAGQLIFHEGQPVPGLYCVGTGLVRVVKDGPTGKQFVLHFAHPGQTFGEVAVFGDFDAPASAEAVEDSLCAIIPREALQGLLREHHELCLQLLGSTSRWVRSLVGLIDGIVLRDSGSRVARYLCEVAPSELVPSELARPFALGVLKKDLAAHLNLTQETLSRTLRKLADAGIIDSLPDGTVRIRDGIALRNVAESGFMT